MKLCWEWLPVFTAAQIHWNLIWNIYLLFNMQMWIWWDRTSYLPKYFWHKNQTGYWVLTVFPIMKKKTTIPLLIQFFPYHVQLVLLHFLLIILRAWNICGSKKILMLLQLFRCCSSSKILWDFPLTVDYSAFSSGQRPISENGDANWFNHYTCHDEGMQMFLFFRFKNLGFFWWLVLVWQYLHSNLWLSHS